ncbi:TonB-dependent hemoglobin/transferrin/lactoferrin family receptor [Pseudomonas sp. MF6772]|uniref:TonB-dependent receptor n=1 Tax=Pseudomonas TaxID=286 RepID=UPI000DF94318|nr:MULTISPECIES: TonB-dependent receptor [Pseudomonas]MBJ2267757.1 TonB-dependent hemoglobin/transferrin/lactoferrin family receptor [Pseudomonas sp. MF6772]MCU0214109.1 TonB-dependent hemoglobin/transferrin/lactoferrin family receptor [Pseudomonas shahriarae]NMY21652.1 TonB-dependent hemoglobin/transferrin/lactoferrin family receptor [Pseudomonas sp. WS 5410]SUD43343.1 putative TonB-dependent receptor protein [Pseudomonas fluorescens]
MFRAPCLAQHLFVRPTLIAACLAVSLTAQAESFTLQLPAQPLATSLSQVAQQAKIQLLFDEDLLKNIQAPALNGDFTPEVAIRTLLNTGAFTLIKVGNTYVVRPEESRTTNSASLQLDALSVIGTGNQVDASTVGRSTLSQADIDRLQPNNIASLVQTLPGVTMGGSMKPGGQIINIRGMGEAEDVPMTVDGATKSGFERYQQGTIFIEPEMIKNVEVEKGPHSAFTGNGGFGGTVNMVTKDAPDLLKDGRNSGAMLKYGYASNDHEQVYTGAVYGRTEDGRIDALAYLTQRDGGDLKLAAARDYDSKRYPINPQRLPNSAQDVDGQLFKLNMYLTDEHSLGFSYSRANSERWTPFSSRSYPSPPQQKDIDLYGYEAAVRRYLANRHTVDTTWSGKYEYHPLDNPLIDMKLSYSESNTDQTDERDATAVVGLSTGGRKMDTAYTDKILELRNISRFNTGPLDHALTTGVQIRKHIRDTDSWMPGAKYDTPEYNYGHFQPAFMPHGKVDTNAFYIQDAVTLGDVTITPSLRYDHVLNRGKANDAPYYSNPDPAYGHDYGDRTYAGWSPRLAVFWKVTPDVVMFANWSRTWRAPVIDEQYEVQGLGSRTSTSRNLDPERITAITVGNVTSFANVIASGDSLQLRSTLFHNKIEDEIFKATGLGCAQQNSIKGSIAEVCTDMASKTNYRNVGSMTIKGFELEGYYDSTYLFGSLSYSWATGKRENPYTNPWATDIHVWARDIPPAKWVAVLGTKIPAWDAQVGWQGQFVRKTDRLPSDKYSGGLNSGFGDSFYDQYPNASYDTQGLFAKWTPQQAYLKGTEVNFTVDNLFNRSYMPALSGDSATSVGRNAKISVTRFF